MKRGTDPVSYLSIHPPMCDFKDGARGGVGRARCGGAPVFGGTRNRPRSQTHREAKSPSVSMARRRAARSLIRSGASNGACAKKGIDTNPLFYELLLEQVRNDVTYLPSRSSSALRRNGRARAPRPALACGPDREPHGRRHRARAPPLQPRPRRRGRRRSVGAAHALVVRDRPVGSGLWRRCARESIVETRARVA